MKTILVVLMLITTTMGCATKTEPLASSVGRRYEGKTITFSQRKQPAFFAHTAGKAQLGIVGPALMFDKGNEIIRENEVPDPAITIGKTLVNDLATQYGLIVIQPSSQASSFETTQTASDYSKVDLVLDVQSRGWGFGYLPLDWSNYYVRYAAKLLLIDTKSATEIASGSCAYDSKDNAIHPSYDSLIDNGATGLKNELKKAEKQCIFEFRQRIFAAN